MRHAALSLGKIYLVCAMRPEQKRQEVNLTVSSDNGKLLMEPIGLVPITGYYFINQYRQTYKTLRHRCNLQPRPYFNQPQQNLCGVAALLRQTRPDCNGGASREMAEPLVGEGRQ